MTEKLLTRLFEVANKIFLAFELSDQFVGHDVSLLRALRLERVFVWVLHNCAHKVFNNKH